MPHAVDGLENRREGLESPLVWFPFAELIDVDMHPYAMPPATTHHPLVDTDTHLGLCGVCGPRWAGYEDLYVEHRRLADARPPRPPSMVLVEQFEDALNLWHESAFSSVVETDDLAIQPPVRRGGWVVHPRILGRRSRLLEPERYACGLF